MTNQILVYFILWIFCTVSAVVYCVFRFQTISLFTKSYLIWLFSYWRLISYLVALVVLSALSTIARDPTWDIPETIIMVSLTFFTAPWVVGVIYRQLSKEEKFLPAILALAVILLLFCSSWSYDLYVFIWQGIYPISWSGNLLISPILYVSAGMVWNLESSPSRGAHFAFQNFNWLNSEAGAFLEIINYIALFLLLGVSIFGVFLWINL